MRYDEYCTDGILICVYIYFNFQEQYLFVYQAVTEALMLSSSAMPAAKFPEAYTKLLQMDPKKKKRKLSLDFEVNMPNSSKSKRDIPFKERVEFT